MSRSGITASQLWPAASRRHVDQIRALQVQHVEQERSQRAARAPRPCDSRRGTTDWNGRGRRPAQRDAHRRTPPPGPPASPAHDDLGPPDGDLVQLPVNGDLAVPARCTWTRFPSSFHSTAASAPGARPVFAHFS